MGLPVEEHLRFVCDFFEGDFNMEELSSELRVLKELFFIAFGQEKPSLSLIKGTFGKLSRGQRSLIRNVWRLFQLLLVLPATNATSERTFNAMRRIKSYLRCTMGQSRLNHLMILHYHQDKTNQLKFEQMLNEYVSCNDVRKSTFAMF